LALVSYAKSCGHGLSVEGYMIGGDHLLGHGGGFARQRYL
jgi:hypothetical protein